MKKKSIINGIKIILGSAIGLVLIIYCYQISLTKVFTLSNGDRLMIKRDSSWEVTIGYTYQIKKKDKVIIPESVFFHQWPDKESPIFELVYSVDNKMVAVVTKQNLKAIYILYDFDTETSIPHRGGSEESEEYYLRRDKMLKQFNGNKYDYKLSEDI